MSEVPHPRATPDLIGHEEAERALLDAVASGRLPHAWLICGPPGIGKATLAYRFARFLLAGGARQEAGLFGAPEAPDSLHVPESSPVFARIAAGGHGDLMVLERRFDERRERLKAEIPVEEVRGVVGFLRLTAAEGGWRIVLVDGVERLNASGQNAILKILEEPPDRAVLLLVSDSPGALLPTIRSRTRRLALTALPDQAVAELLARHRPDLDAIARAAIAAYAGGSIGRALSFAEAQGLDLQRDLVTLLAALPNLETPAMHGFADRLGRKGAEGGFETAASLLVWLLERVVRTAAGDRPGAGSADADALVARLAAGRSLDRWLEVWEKVSRLFASTDGAALDRKQVFLTALVAVASAAAG